MPKIDHSIDAAERWQIMLENLRALPIEKRRDLLLQATTYRSGEDSCNSVYMGGMAHAVLREALGDSYPGTKSYSDLIAGVDEATLERGLTAAAHVVEYMLHHPRSRCPCCGQIVRKEQSE